MKKIALAILLVMLPISSEARGIHEAGLSTEVSHITYSENNLVIDGQVINVKESGVMYGVSGFYAYHNKLLLREEGRFSWGDVDYSGTGNIKGVPDYSYELRSLIGWEFMYNTPYIIQHTSITPYSGIGYRYLNDNGKGLIATDGSHFYLRESNYLYIPIGVVLTKEFNGLEFRITPELEALIGGRQVSHLEAINSLPRVSNKQKTGYGVRVEVEVTKHLKSFDIFLAGFVRHWGIQESKESERFVEPKNSSTEVGAKLGVRF